MAHFAQLDENNVVTQVIVVHNSELVESKQTTVNEDGSVSVAVVESEQRGIDFCKSLFGDDTRWVQTSYNNSFRGKYAEYGTITILLTYLHTPPMYADIWGQMKNEVASSFSSSSYFSKSRAPKSVRNSDRRIKTIPSVVSSGIATITKGRVSPTAFDCFD